MQKISRFTRIVLLTCLPIFFLSLGWQLGATAERTALADREQQLATLFGDAGTGAVVGDPEKEVNIDLLWSTWRLLQKHFIHPEDLETQTLVYGAVRGMVSAAGDPYTTFMSPQENSDFRAALDGHLQGIGAELAVRNGLITIVAPLKGSPAERAGLLPDDIIVEVDSTTTEGESLSQVVSRIRGEKGTRVTLTIARHGEPKPLNVTITRADITVPSVEYSVKETATGAVAVLEVNQFGVDTIAESAAALRELARRTNVKGLVIDLRYNGGGYLTGAVDMASFFLKQGKVVSVERRNADPQRHYVSGNPLLPDIPIVVLINEGTASASEIVAGALQDLHRATIVGVTSYGKGTVQEVIDLPGGSSLRVTAAKWVTPNGRDLGKEGVEPDIVVERTAEDIEAGYDPQMEEALELLTEGGE